MAARAWKRRAPACGTTCRCSAAPCKERNLLAHAPKHLHDAIKADFNDMVHARTAAEVLRKAFVAKWRLRCRAVADSLEEAGERLFTFLRYPPEQWRSLRTTNAIERLHEEFKRRIKTQCLLPCAETARDVVLGAVRLRSDHHAPGRRLADPRALTHRP
jgi:transposase-like protein